MNKLQQKMVICQVCKGQKKMSEVMSADIVREQIVEKIMATHPDWSSQGFICIADLNRYREEYVKDLIKADKGELSVLEDQVIKSLKEQELLSQNINVEYDRQRSFGEIMSDKLADFGGSWLFIGIFCSVLFIWIAVNSVVMLMKPFDIYPYIFLNLILSCLAAIQAPVILMSQNRQEVRDRLQAEHDYRINLKAELEIRHLHEKIDHLLMNQWQRLMEIQQIQMELMEELAHKKKREQTE
ncbi:MAG: DUF1003 domain-containing protein [Nitrospirae bacterium]|nr:DUF1003 domain-containing protein [Nitrospirota bacterium]MBI5096699.1 DUF1003 domain-containing protein [Nitrospirota bacterium]